MPGAKQDAILLELWSQMLLHSDPGMGWVSGSNVFQGTYLIHVMSLISLSNFIALGTMMVSRMVFSALAR